MSKTLILRVVRVESRYKKFFVRMVTGRALELLSIQDMEDPLCYHGMAITVCLEVLCYVGNPSHKKIFYTKIPLGRLIL